MCRLLETIRVENGILCNAEAHDERFNRSRLELFGITRPERLKDVVKVPADLGPGVFKCRVIYAREILKVEFEPYRFRPVRTLQPVTDNTLEYPYKYFDRARLEALRNASSADDVIIIRNGFVADSSFSNLVFFDGRRWITPSTFLLDGTMRKTLLESGEIGCEEIMERDLVHFRKAGLINAMRGMKELHAEGGVSRVLISTERLIRKNPLPGSI